MDPGKATGMAWWEEGEHRADTVPYQRALEALAYDAEGWLDLVVVEDFVISERTLRSGSDGWRRGAELEFIGAARWICAQHGVRFMLQEPAERGFATDAKLRAMGWWTVGPDHAREASRHLLTALVRLGEVSAAELVRALGVGS